MLRKDREYVIWLRGILDVTDGDMNEKTTTIVKDKLNGLFEHEAKEKPNNNGTVPKPSIRSRSISTQRLKC